MTKYEWRIPSDPQQMLEFVKDWASDRQLRLFGAACCRHLWHFMTDQRCRDAVEAVERFVEGEADLEEAAAAWRAALEAVSDLMGKHAEPAEYAARSAAANLAESCLTEPWYECRSLILHVPAGLAADLLRDVFGNPYRGRSDEPNSPGWRNETVVRLARAIYEVRELPSGHLDRERLAVLADALEEAGCPHTEMLAHCRSREPHVRGCWVVDHLMIRAHAAAG